MRQQGPFYDLRSVDIGPGQLSPKEVAKNCPDCYCYYFMLEMACGLNNICSSVEILQGGNPCSGIRRAVGKKTCACGQFQDYK